MPQPTLEQIAEAIHKARWPEDRQTAITPFADEDDNGRAYCFRLARAVQRLYVEDLSSVSTHELYQRAFPHGCDASGSYTPQKE